MDFLENLIPAPEIKAIGLTLVKLRCHICQSENYNVDYDVLTRHGKKKRNGSCGYDRLVTTYECKSCGFKSKSVSREY
jgi:hypothetical protein